MPRLNRPIGSFCGGTAGLVLSVQATLLRKLHPAAASGWAPVYRLVKRIPRGRVATYGQVARALKLRGGARSAGRAMAGCPAGKGIPWHRVLGAGGRLLIREPHAGLQRKLLESEGVAFIERRVNMKLHTCDMRKIQKK